MSARLLRPDDPAWDEWIGRTAHDFHHRAAYHAFAERMGEGRALLAVHGERDRFVAFPYLLRDAGGGGADATSVYGYTGPVGPGLEDEDARAAAWAAFRAAWRGQGLASLFARFHPVLGNARHAAALRGEEAPPGGEVATLGRSVSMDATLPEAERRAIYPQPLRQDVKRAERDGLTVERDAGWHRFGTFAALYRRTMERNGASGRYLFSDRYLEGLREALAPDAHLLVALREGRVAGALLLVVHGGLATAHLTGIDDALSRYSPLKLLIDRACDHARELGATRLHLGAGRGGAEDALFRFKGRFSPTRHPFAVGRWILDRRAYARMTERAGVDPDAARAFFPAYRAPAVPQSA